MNLDDIKKAVESLPDDVAELDNLIGEIRALYEKTAEEAGDNPTAEQVDVIEALADAMERVKAKRNEVVKAGEDRAARAAAARDVFAVEDEGEPEETDDPEGEDDPEGDADDSAGEDDEDDEPAEEPENEEDKNMDKSEGELSARRKFAGRTRGTSKVEQEQVKVSPFSLAPGAPNFRAGEATMRDLAEAFNAVSSGRAIRATTVGTSTQSQFAHITRDLPDSLTAVDEQSLVAAVDHATDEKRLEGNSLVAAGGWCAPSETVYDFLPTPSAAALLSLPEITVNRGGLRYPVQPDFSALYDATKFHMTEAQAISGKTKECVEIPCAEMEEVRLDVLWTCVTSNLLANAGWPELTAKFIEEATRGHLHRLASARLATVIEKSVKANAGIPGVGTIGTVLNAIELHAESLRQKFRLGVGTLEGIAPSWLRAVLRADLAYRDEVLPERVTNEALEQHFADRGIRFQFVDDYQPLPTDPAKAAYPGEVKVILYPAGTFFSAVNRVVNLSAVYDSAGLSKNQRTELFIEDGYGVGKRGYESREVTIPLKINGQVGLRADVAGAGAGASQ